MSNTAPSRADPVVVFPLGRWCPPQETSQPHPPPCQGHGWGQSLKSQLGSHILSSHILLVPCQSTLSLLLPYRQNWHFYFYNLEPFRNSKLYSPTRRALGSCGHVTPTGPAITHCEQVAINTGDADVRQPVALGPYLYATCYAAIPTLWILCVSYSLTDLVCVQLSPL